MAFTKPINYAKLDYQLTQQFLRYKERIKNMPNKLICQECGGAGGKKEIVLDDGSGPWHDCGWCFGTGYTTGYLRNLWLRWQKEERDQIFTNLNIEAAKYNLTFQWSKTNKNAYKLCFYDANTNLIQEFSCKRNKLDNTYRFIRKFLKNGRFANHSKITG